MLSCGHERNAFGEPLCVHMRTCRKPWLRYVKWYTGRGFMTELVCIPCAEAREKGHSVEVECVCQECFEYAVHVGSLTRTGGQAEIKVRSIPFDNSLKEFAIPKELGRIVDVAPVNESNQSIWLMLAEDGSLYRVNISGGDWTKVGAAIPPSEPDHEPWGGHGLRRHLHVSNHGEFAAVVNDYGRYGQVVDLRSGNVTMRLDGGEYHPETVPFSFAFVDLRGKVLAIHRTDWNRLDISDPSSGKLLSERAPTSYLRGEERPQHYLDYFHGALYASPGNKRILDDGWIWHPFGVTVTWELEPWLTENPWEPEDGPTKRTICDNDYWGESMTWLDDERLAIAGIGQSDNEMIDGARIFDVTQIGKYYTPEPEGELIAFPGPGGKFFSDGKWLYSSDKTGLSRWDPQNGDRTGHLETLHPTHHHAGAGQLVQLTDSTLVQWSTTE